LNSTPPLAEILRPDNLDDYIGQDHIVGEGAILRKAIETGNIPSMIFWGPPGVGKTTLAFIISKQLQKPFFTLSAISSGVKDVREVINDAKTKSTGAILFIDEIHRFNKSQQDSLLGAVEKGIITLIGATTENPSFEVISPLLSRCQVYILKDLDKQNLLELLGRGKNYLAQKFNLKIEITENEALLRVSGGDARKLLNALELVTSAFSGKDKTVIIDNEKVQKVIQKNLAIYDKSGEMHYDIISAFIKSMRGSDPNAAVYWLARMVEAGEDPLFIARRMLILASEDIGNANPNALLLAQTCFEAVNVIGYPECRIILSQTAVYLASSPKSNASYMAIKNAQETVNSTGDLPVPLHLRNAPTRLMKEIGYGDGYRYAHDFQNNFTDLEFLPDNIRGKKFYDPGDNPKEKEIRARLKQLWKEKYKY
jgi:putative ATPase